MSYNALSSLQDKAPTSVFFFTSVFRNVSLQVKCACPGSHDEKNETKKREPKITESEIYAAVCFLVGEKEIRAKK